MLIWLFNQSFIKYYQFIFIFKVKNTIQYMAKVIILNIALIEL